MNFNQVNIGVIGDLMLDRYWYGGTQRISPEAPVPVVHVDADATEHRPGGAANVALNIAALGAKVRLMGVTGDDEPAQLLTQQLQAAKVSCEFIQLAHIPTITKLRVISRHQQLIRLDFETNLLATDVSGLTTKLQQQLVNFDALVLSDYGKGTLQHITQLIEIAVTHHVPVLIDPKGTDFDRYHHATVLTPNIHEFEAVVGHCANEQAIENKGQKLLHRLNLQALLITRGEQGMSLLQRQAPALHLPTKAKEVFDVTGAGDTVISVLATAYASGTDLPTATLLANIAAGIVVGKLGTAHVTDSELRLALKNEQEHEQGIVTESLIIDAVNDAKTRGKTIVMTNGCFDLLHAGHVTYLEQARKLGDRLIVAVNDDVSVKRLKGDNRPINPVEQRMAVLAGLSSVDWVVSFGDDTPAALIEKILPDVLVKGGDYQAEDVAGYQCVTDHGGRVEILNYLEGCSTTAIINAIQAKP